VVVAAAAVVEEAVPGANEEDYHADDAAQYGAYRCLGQRRGWRDVRGGCAYGRGGRSRVGGRGGGGGCGGAVTQGYDGGGEGAIWAGYDLGDDGGLAAEILLANAR
jgi:hypothetical protein